MLKFRVSSKSCVAALDPDTERLDQQEDSQPLQSYLWVFFEPAVAHIILDSAFLFKLDPDWIQIQFGSIDSYRNTYTSSFLFYLLF